MSTPPAAIGAINGGRYVTYVPFLVGISAGDVGVAVAAGASVSSGGDVSSELLPEETRSPGAAGMGVASAGSVLSPSWANAQRGSRPIRSSAIKSRGKRCLIFFT